jgi:hypothetical protein
MPEKRRLDRINYTMVGELVCNDKTVACRLENLSMAGALVTTRGLSISGMRVKDVCTLRLNCQSGKKLVTIQAQVAHHIFAFVGLTFGELDPETAALLESIISKNKALYAATGDSSAFC